MSARLALLLVGLVAGRASASAQGAPTPFGEWARGDGLAHVRIARCGPDICAINTWIKPSDTSEKLGDRLVMRVHPDGATRLKGSAFDPQRDLSYGITLDLGASRMTTRGCIMGGLLCKSMRWTRIARQ